MQYTVNRGEKGKVDVKVDVPKAGFEKVYDEVLTKLGQETNIAGFRPGKVPRDVILAHVGTNKVLNQTASFLISKHLGEILKRENLIPIDSPKIAIETLAAESPFSFTASFTQKPEIKVGDWKKIKVTKVAAKEITDADVNESIKNIFEAWKKSRETKGRRDEETENIEHKIATTEDAEAKSEGESSKFIYDAHGNKVFFGKKTLRSSSLDKPLGHELGAEWLGTAGLKIPIKDQPNPAQSTPGVGFDSPGVKQTPDDEFAKAIGARDLAHLRELVKKDLEIIVADQVEAKFEQDLYGEILKIAEVEVPDILIENELNRILVRLSSELERQGSDLEKYLAEQKITVDQLKEKWRPQAEKNVRITLVMDEIGRGEGVKVSREEIDQAIKGVNQTNMSTEQKADLERYLALSIFQAKTLDLVRKAVAA